MNLVDFPLWTAVITPMLEDESVDYQSLEKVLRAQEEAGNGLLILGSTGESLNLDIEEKKEILDYTIGLNLRCPIMVGVGGVNLKKTKAWVQYLQTKNVHAYLMVTPLYAKPETKGQTRWFQQLMDLSTRPCMLYNVPSRTGKSLSIDSVRELSSHQNFWAIKEASGSVADFRAYREAAPNAQVFSGDDALFPDFLEYGCAGLVSVASNAWPKETHLYVNQGLSGEIQDVALWKRCSQSLFSVSNPIPVKRLMKELGQIETPHLRLPLCADDLTDTSELLAANGEINGWYQRQTTSEL